MVASFTCSRHLPAGANTRPYNTHSRRLSLLHTSPITTPSTAAEHGQPRLSPSKTPAVEILSQSTSPNLTDMSSSKTTIKIAEITVDTDLSRPRSNPIKPSIKEIDSGSPAHHPSDGTPPASVPGNRRTSKRKRTVSPPSPSKPPGDHRRSASRSTRRSAPNSRRSSFQSHRRVATNASLTPSMSGSVDPEHRQEDLLALHRESCRLFQDIQDAAACSTPPRARPSPPASTRHSRPQTHRASSEIGSPPVSPILRTQGSIASRDGHHHSPLRNQSVSTASYEPPHIHPIQHSTTVIDWTSPSTRRREYEKIDRASSGVRGFWRRIAPRWCQFGDSRMPFFEEGKDGKGNYEGSVRRFRMDLPEEPGTDNKRGAAMGLKIKRRFTVSRMGSR